MIELLGTSLFLVGGIYWSLIAGGRSNTTVQSLVSLALYGSLNLGLFSLFGLLDDEITHFSFGVELANSLAEDWKSASTGFSQGKQSYVWILAFLILAFGATPLPGLALSTLLMAMLPAVFVSAGRNLGLLQSGNLTAWLTVFSPPLLLWGHGLDREPFVFFLLGTFVLGLSWILLGRWISAATIILTVAGLISITRSSLLPVVIVGTLAFVFLSISRSKRDTVFPTPLRADRWLWFVGLSSVGLVFSGARVVLELGNSEQWSSLGVGIREISVGQSTGAEGASWEYNSSIHGFANNLGRSLAGPPVSEVVNNSMLFFAIEGFGYFIFFLILVCGLFGRQTRDIQALLMMTSIPLVVGSALLLANYGLNSRVRAHIFVLLLLCLEPAADHILGRLARLRDFQDAVRARREGFEQPFSRLRAGKFRQFMS